MKLRLLKFLHLDQQVFFGRDPFSLKLYVHVLRAQQAFQRNFQILRSFQLFQGAKYDKRLL